MRHQPLALYAIGKPAQKLEFFGALFARQKLVHISVADKFHQRISRRNVFDSGRGILFRSCCQQVNVSARYFLSQVGVKSGRAFLDPSNFSTASGHKHTRGWPGCTKNSPFSSYSAAISSHSPPAPRSAMAAAVVDFPAPAGPANTTAASFSRTALACNGVTPRLRRTKPMTGPSKYVTRSSGVSGGGQAPQISRPWPSTKNSVPSP